MSLNAISVSHNIVQFPLKKVSFSFNGGKRIDQSPLLLSLEEPETDMYNNMFMAYYFLNDELDTWFRDIKADFKIIWNHEKNLWFLELDKKIATMFKLAWCDSIYFNN